MYPSLRAVADLPEIIGKGTELFRLVLHRKISSSPNHGIGKQSVLAGIRIAHCDAFRCDRSAFRFVVDFDRNLFKLHQQTFPVEICRVAADLLFPAEKVHCASGHSNCNASSQPTNPPPTMATFCPRESILCRASSAIVPCLSSRCLLLRLLFFRLFHSVTTLRPAGSPRGGRS